MWKRRRDWEVRCVEVLLYNGERGDIGKMIGIGSRLSECGYEEKYRE